MIKETKEERKERKANQKYVYEIFELSYYESNSELENESENESENEIKRRRRYQKEEEEEEEEIYGIFNNNSDDDNDNDSDDNTSTTNNNNSSDKKRKKKRNEKYNKRKNYSKKNEGIISFISSNNNNNNTSNTTPTPLTTTTTTTTTIPLNNQETLELNQIDENEQQFRQLIGKGVGFGNNNNDFRRLVNEISEKSKEEEEKKEKEKDVSKPKPSAPISTENLGKWEKHTKGFGKKMLEKMGFTGRLGARETGISAAVEVKHRPEQMGLGFGDFVEATMLESNKKLEAELLGKEYVPVEKPKEKKSSAKGIAEKRAESKSWKLGGTVLTEKELLGFDQTTTDKSDQPKSKKSKKNKEISFGEMIGIETESSETKQTIIDMRGPAPKFVLDPGLLGLNDQENYEKNTGPPLLGQELLYNLNLVVDMEQHELDRLDRKLNSINTRLLSVEVDIHKMEEQLDIDQTSYDAYNTIREVLNKIETTLQQVSNSDNSIDSYKSLSLPSSSSKSAAAVVVVPSSVSIQFEMIVNAFIKLIVKYPREIILLGFIDIIPVLGESIISKEILQWDIVENPMKLIDLYVQWMSSLSAFEIQDEDDMNENKSKIITKQIIHSFAGKFSGFDENSNSIVQTAYDNLHQIIEKYSIPKLRRYLLNEWNVKNVEEVINCTNLIKGLKSIYNHQVYEDLINTAILPKLTNAVSSWSPTTDRTTIDSWILPWKKIIGTPLTSLFPEIRRKITKALTQWDPLDHSAYYVIKPWNKVFDSTSMENLLVRNIIPKLVTAMRMQSVEPNGQSTSYFTSILLWSDIIPKQHILAIIEGEFFPKWFQVLSHWLGSDDPDYSDISTWYTNWKSSFPDSLLQEQMIIEYFNMALDMMSTALSNPTLKHFPIPQKLNNGQNNYFQIIQNYNYLNKLIQNEKLFEKNSNISTHSTHSSSISVSFRDVIEKYCQEHFIEFKQKFNYKTGEVMSTIDGKSLWEFNGILCYIDNNVLYVKEEIPNNHNNRLEKKNKWIPISLDDIYQLSLIKK